MCLHIHSGHLLFVLSLIFPGRLRIYGQSRLCDGPSDESARAARKSLCSSDCRIRLRRAAIMATRTMEQKQDRITTVLMAPFMSCGARLPVYVLFATAFWPMSGQNLVFGLYLIGILAAIATGFMLKRTALAGQTSAFVMEIPPYHLPTAKNILLRTWDRLKSFIFRAGKVIVVLVAVLCFLNSLGTDGSFGNQDSDKSVLSQIGKTIVPVFKPMGVSEENWPAAVGVFTGILAKEAVVGTLDSLYSGIGGKAEEQAAVGEPAAKIEEQAQQQNEEEGFNLARSFGEAVASIGEGFGDIGAFFTDPLGISVESDLSDVALQAEEQEVSTGTIAAMNKLFDGELGAFAYLLMVLLYLPLRRRYGCHLQRGRKRLGHLLCFVDNRRWLQCCNYRLSSRLFQCSSGVFSSLYRRLHCDHCRNRCRA